MATLKTRSAAPVEAPVVEAAPAAPAAPTAPSAFNMPRLTAKPVKAVEAPAVSDKKYESDGSLTLSGVTRGAIAAPDKKRIIVTPFGA